MANEMKENYSVLNPQEALIKSGIKFNKSNDGRKFFINPKGDDPKGNDIEKGIAIYQQRVKGETDKFQWKAYERGANETSGTAIGNIIDVIAKVKKLDVEKVLKTIDNELSTKPNDKSMEYLNISNKRINDKYNCEIISARKPELREIPNEFVGIPIENLAIIEAKFQNFKQEDQLQTGIAITNAMYQTKDGKDGINKYPTGVIKLDEPFHFINKQDQVITCEKLAINQNSGKYIYQKNENATKLIITNDTKSFANAQGQKDTSIIYTNNLRNTDMLDKQIEKLKPQMKEISFEHGDIKLNKTQENFKQKISAMSKSVEKAKSKEPKAKSQEPKAKDKSKSIER